MDKGKFKKEKSYFSIMFVPHSLGKVKALRFSSLYAKIAAITVLILTTFICAGILIADTIKENQALKSSISQLCIINAEQKNLLNSKAAEINTLKVRETEFNDKIKDFMDKYREITENYISERSDRAGNRDERSFSNDITELKVILSTLNKISTSEDSALLNLSETENKLKDYLDSIPTLWPTVGKLSDKYGYRRDPFTHRNTLHEGLDISSPRGSAIKAAGSGKVVFSGKKSGYGYAVIIDHGHGIKTLYAHTSKLLVKEGQSVSKGDIIAKVGSSGRSTGPHLHFEVQIGSTPVDPLKYLDSKS